MDKGRIAELDGVRGLAILLVLLSHLCLHFSPQTGTVLAYFARINWLSWSGVDLFFVLSGFLIGGQLIDARGQRAGLTRFYIRRLCRIQPIYLVVLAVIVLLASLGVRESGTTVIPLGWYLSLTQNFWMVLHDSWSFAYAQTWSLAVEEQFYILAPALLLYAPRRWLWPLLCTFVVASPVLRILIVLYTDHPLTPVHVLLPCRMDALLIGVLLAYAQRQDAFRKWTDTNPMALNGSFGLLAAVLLFCLIKGYALGTLFMMTCGYTVLALFYGCLMLLSLRGGVIGRGFRLKPLRWLGSIAYGVYLMHGLVPAGMHWISGHRYIENLYDSAIFALLTVIVFLVAQTSWVWFEQPIINWGKLRSGAGRVEDAAK